jgi:hypothetical protein
MARRGQIREDGRAFDIENIKISVRYKDSQYSLKKRDKTSIGPTGEWIIFELEHADGHLYRGRWDECASALDIDLFPSGNAQKPKKKFPGHHTNQPDPNVRIFDVDVVRHGTRISSATVSFTLMRRMSFKASTAPSSATLVKQPEQRRSLQRVWSYVWFRVSSLLSRK